MSQHTLEERVALLEQTVAGLIAATSPGEQRRKDWRNTIGMFEGDPVIREIQEEGQRLREAERREARQGARS
jgi:hypothetical protein